MKRWYYWLPPAVAGGALLLCSAPLGFGTASLLPEVPDEVYLALLKSCIGSFQLLGVVLLLAAALNYATRNSDGSKTVVMVKQ